MAKKKSTSTPKKSKSTAAKKPFSSSSVRTNTFNKGMNKDIAQSLELNTQWWHARNAANNDADGDVGLIGNEPANLQCGVIPYTIIGAIHRYGDEWIVFSTDDISSEIGRFDDSECKYTPLVSAPCLKFKKKYLITGAAKENFDCTWQVYWDDGLNPSRSLNIDDIPYIQEITSAPGDPCIVYSDKEPKVLDCEKIRLAPLVSTPCIKLNKSRDGGMLEDGAYQAFVAYVENEQRVTDYIGISNIQTLWNHNDNSCGLELNISELDKRYEYFQLTLLIRNQGQLFRKIVGLYSTEITDINIDFLDPALVSETAVNLFFVSPSYEKSDAMYVVNDWLIRQGPTTQFDFNYQPIANNIITSFVINQVPADYYYKAGNKLGFMRDEQYAFFIRWIYNTGERSASYHIPGRAPKPYTLPTGLSYNEDEKIATTNSINVLGDEEYVFQVYNTGAVTQSVNEVQEDGTIIIARGEMGYWQSTEKYPSNRPDIWGDLCGKNIRHHKIPSEQIGGNQLHLTSSTEDFIHILGVEFSNIGRPTYNDGSYIENVVGYEIMRGSRLGAKSILAKGMFKNMREYDVPDNENLIGGDVQGLYVNYPYNDLRDDIYFTTTKQTEGCDDGVEDSVDNHAPLKGYRKDVFSFHSPDLMFTKPYLNANETKIYGEINGESSGGFIPSEDHPGEKLLRNISSIIAALIGVGYAIRQIQGTPDTRAIPTQAINNAFPEWKINAIDGASIGGGQGTLLGGYGQGTITAQYGGEISGGDGDNNEKPNQTAGVTGAPTGASQNIGSYYAAQTSLASFLSNLLTGAATGLTDLVSASDATERLNDLALDNLNDVKKYGDGFMGGGAYQGITKDSPDSNMPRLLKIAMNFMLAQKNIAIGGQEIIDLMYNLSSYQQYALKYNSHGFYNQFIPKDIGDRFRSHTRASNYLGSSFQTFDNNQFKINNLYRPDCVAVSIDNEFDANYTVEDRSRFVLGGYINSGGTGVDSPNSNLLSPQGPFKEPISAMYGALKFNMDNQYGQLDGIKQIHMRGCVEKLDPTLPDTYMYGSKAIFSGDVFISRYTEKHIMPIFTDFLMGQYDGYPYDYHLRVNIPYPRYWMNTKKFDMGSLAQTVSTLGLQAVFGSGPTLPNDMFYLDRGTGECNVFDAFANGFAESDLNETFSMVHAYMYTHVNGVNDFYVESEINLPYRDWEEPKERRFYDIYTYNDLGDLFHAEIQKFDNFYKYDESLSPSKFQSQITTFGRIQPRDYDPLVAETCYTRYPKRLIYSLQAQNELKKDFWRVFLPLNYKDFKGAVSVIKPFSKSGAVVFFPYLSPQLFQGTDQLTTMSDNKLTIGDGGLFSQPFQNITNSDVSNEYGSCESLRSVVNTPAGLFFISQAQGKIFQYSPKGGINPISNLGMKFWFNEYLPSSLIKQFPALENSPLSDNPVAGVGCQTIYDTNDDIVYFMKRDYKVKSQHISKVIFDPALGFLLDVGTTIADAVPITLGDPIYFHDCSWTVSYDPKSKAWISFHDWHPELALPSINHFFTTKTQATTIPQCPPGFNFNPTTGLCEQGSNYDAPANVTPHEVAATITGGSTNCLIDLVITIDVSGSTVPGCGNPALPCNYPDYAPMTFDPVTGAQTGGGTWSNQCNANASLAWLDQFLNDPLIKDPMAAGDMQIGFGKWAQRSRNWRTGTNSSALSMSSTVTSAQVLAWFNPLSPTGGNIVGTPPPIVTAWQGGAGDGTNASTALGQDDPLQNIPTLNGTEGILSVLNDKTNSSLAADYPARALDTNFKQIAIVVTDGNINSVGALPLGSTIQTLQSSAVNGPGTNPSGSNNTGSWFLSPFGNAFGNRTDVQEIVGVFVGETPATSSDPCPSAVPANTQVLNSLTNTPYNTTTNTPGNNQYTMNALCSSSLEAAAEGIAGSVCGTPFVCACPAGYTKVFFDSNTGYYNSLTSATDNCDDAVQAGTPPICRKVDCDCDPGGTLTSTGDCPSSAPEIYQIGDPAWVDTDPLLCNYNTFISVEPNYNVGSFWRHNDRCDLFANYYGKDYPWEIDLISNTGQSVNTIRSIEYQLETYVYKGTMGNSCGGDAWEDLNFNFDQATIYNNEQVSGLLLLNMAPYNDPWNELNYPVIGPSSIDVLASKVEQKFRLNQFWDITNDRGEFSNAEQPVWSTACNGYVRTLNSVNLNYNKPETQRKKFRHYSNHVLLRRRTSNNRKMLLRLNNTKLNLSMR